MNSPDAPAPSCRKSSRSDDTGGACVEAAWLPSQWRKSSRSTNSGGACVEVASMFPVSAAEWRKSGHSDSSGAWCIEVADLVSAVAVRDSKDPDGPKLVFDASAWSAFATRAKNGHLDLT